MDKNNVELLLFNTKAKTINNTNTYGYHYMWGSVTSVVADDVISLRATKEEVVLDYQVKEKILFKASEHFTYDKDVASDKDIVLSYSLLPYVSNSLMFNTENGYLSGSVLKQMEYQGEVCASTGEGERACYTLYITGMCILLYDI
jgi:hypothetical protein